MCVREDNGGQKDTCCIPLALSLRCVPCLLGPRLSMSRGDADRGRQGGIGRAEGARFVAVLYVACLNVSERANGHVASESIHRHRSADCASFDQGKEGEEGGGMPFVGPRVDGRAARRAD